jgi:histone-lysine N-methyltransferase SETD1
LCRFNPKDIVIEYVGEKIRHPVGDKREKTNDDCYMFALDNEYIIDATFYGNKARYINHSCDPNLKSDKLVINGETHIIFYALRHIEKAEELCFDYQFDYEEKKIECFCMAKNCKGRLN